MAVILTDGLYQVRKSTHPWSYDPDGQKIPAPQGAPGPLRPGAAHMRSVAGRDGTQSTWVLRLDPAEWPVGDGDKVQKPASGDVWTATGDARLCKHNVDGSLDYVEVTAALDPPTAP